MAICPIANSIGCNKCGIVNFCFVKTVLGNYGEEQPGQNALDDSMDDVPYPQSSRDGGGRVESGTTTEAESVKSESKPPD